MDRTWHPGDQNRYPSSQVPIAMLLPFIRPHLNRDRALQLDSIYAKLRENDISREGFLRHMKGIVGSPLIVMAVEKVQAQIASSSHTRSEQFQLQTQAPLQHEPQIPSTTTLLGVGVDVEKPAVKDSTGRKKPALKVSTAQKKPAVKVSTGRKKLSDAIRTSSPRASKKQKVLGDFPDQSIKHVNDVIAFSGVDLREEEENLLFGAIEGNGASQETRAVVQEQEERLILERIPLEKKLAVIMSRGGIKNISSNVERCLSLCVEERMRGFICNLIRLSKQRVDIEKRRHRSCISSDVRHQIVLMNRIAKEDLENKEDEEAEELQILDKGEGITEADGEKDKEKGCLRLPKVNKYEDEKIWTTAANVAARVAVGGYDLQSKLLDMIEARQKPGDGMDIASSAVSNKDMSDKPLLSSGINMKEDRDARIGPSSASGMTRKTGRQPAMTHTNVRRSVCVKDVIAALEREPQMSKSTFLYRLFERMPGDVAAPTE